MKHILVLGLVFGYSVVGIGQDATKLVISEENVEDQLDQEVLNVLSKDMPEKVKASDKQIGDNTASDETNKTEAEIPVLASKPIVAAEPESPYSRLVLSFVVIIVFAGVMYSVSRWWKKKTLPKGENNKISVLTQHYLGPKKSLAIIRVAGETILIGVTDANINMIKSLSLLDEETSSFAGVLVEKSNGPTVATGVRTTTQDDDEDFSFSEIKDKISSKLKELRPI